ncbi:hypothetical protein BC351_13470 [Paenibacillus ferrarius]|uniref:Uncharacterized protein n=1 Tax=Paenibacillus ferrarius TaxID=1469647 RepID=A0A1V4H791_9BACL|nr:hypothetical protein [Paenibacillus ferrarius]OPH46929.1 hypothetical protein BC351_13470 [Paenibacillus ferrarius]
MNQLNATSEQWKSLYEAAAAFKQAECWRYATNSHVFGVENPFNKEIGYCCILGNGGEMYGLAVYLGTESLETLLSMLNRTQETDPMFSQHCLMLSFESRTELYPAELKQIKELGLKFRGANAWPTFRLYEPGFVPWPMQNEEEVQFLSLALEQTIEVVEAFKNNLDAIFIREDNVFLTRVSEGDRQNLVWTDQWLKPKILEKATEYQANPIDEIRLAKAKKMLKGFVGIWEVDCFFAYIPIDEGQRPYYPMMGLIVDQESEQILQFGLTEKSGIQGKMAGLFLEIIEKAQVVPKEIWVCREEIYHYLKQILISFEIQVCLKSELAAIEDARVEMMDYLIDRI